MNLAGTLYIKKMNKLIITIFGATGDLTLRKLLPALETLIKTQKDYESLTIVAVGRRAFTSEEYLSFVSESNAFSGDINTLRPYLVYTQVDALKPNTYENLKTLFSALSSGKQSVRKIFYLAVGPDLFLDIASNLLDTKLVTKGDLNSIIAFEKPFGHTFEDARFINAFLEEKFSPAQIYRVDHYLGKEMIQNIIDLRFSNTFIHAIWNNEHIREIKIVVSEKDGILNRGVYYDEVGVLNDMVQSHLLQILALLVMDIPHSLASEDIQNAKIAALEKVKYIASESLLGQYKGYRNELGVDPDSLISTLAFLRVEVQTPKYKGIPIYLITGKKLARKEAYIEIIFKDAPGSHLFAGSRPNRLIIEIAPESRITLELNSLAKLHTSEVVPTKLEHCFSCNFPGAIKEAYSALFTEMIHGRKTLFPSFNEIAKAWDIICQIRDEKPRYFIYEPGFDMGGNND